MTFWVYLLRCADGSFYVGHTDDLERRVAEHESGALPGYTHSRRPVELVWSAEFASRDEALTAERQVKGWSRAKKEALIAGNWERVSLLSQRRKPFETAASPPPQGERKFPLAVHPEEALKPQAEAPPRRAGSPNPVRPEEALKPQAEEPSRRTATHLPPPPVIVLVRPQLGENIGKAARAMLNFGLTRLRLVAPRDGWPNPDAGPAAAGADMVLAQAEVFDTLAEAVADCAHVYATTVRKRGVTKPVVTPDEAAAQIVGEPGLSALVFGPERSGLETDDVALARHILTVPINPEFGSLNLAQAVILCAYDWSRAVRAGGHAALVQPTLTDALPPAPQAELDALIDRLEAMLEPTNYFFPEDRAPATRRTLRGVLTKPGWNHLEVRTLQGVLSALAGKRRSRG